MSCELASCNADGVVVCRTCKTASVCFKHMLRGCSTCHAVVIAPRIAHDTGIPSTPIKRSDLSAYELTYHDPGRVIHAYVAIEADMVSCLDVLHHAWIADVYYRAVLSVPPHKSAALVTWRPPEADKLYREHLMSLIGQFHASQDQERELKRIPVIPPECKATGTMTVTVPLVRSYQPLAVKLRDVQSGDAVRQWTHKMWMTLHFLHRHGIAHNYVTCFSFVLPDPHTNVVVLDSTTLTKSMFAGTRSRDIISDQRAAVIAARIHDNFATGTVHTILPANKSVALSTVWQTPDGLALFDWYSDHLWKERSAVLSADWAKFFATPPAFWQGAIEETGATADLFSAVQKIASMEAPCNPFALDVCALALHLAENIRTAPNLTSAAADRATVQLLTDFQGWLTKTAKLSFGATRP